MHIKPATFATLLALSSMTSAPQAQSSLSIDWEWKKAHQCSSTSPAFSIAGIPSEAASLAITLVDQDATHFDHGGGTVSHSGEATAAIPDGALKSYKGPCPPNFSSFGHDYTFTVRAIAADGKTELSRGSKTQTFSSKTVKQ